MRRFGLVWLLLFGATLGSAHAAAPAAPSFHGVEATIGRIRDGWAKPGAAPEPNAPGWNALFDALQADLKSFAAASSDNDRLTALNRIYQVSVALKSVTWTPAADLREALRSWLRPRVRLAWAERKLVDSVHRLPPAADPAVKGNRDQWVKFVNDDLGRALHKYDAAATVSDRHEALQGVYAALGALHSRNQASRWAPSIDLQAALDDLYNLPNIDVSIDLPTLDPFIDVNLITTGPVYRRGYVSQVTAGPKTGFGLMSSDDGIAFYNKQLLTSVTPVWDFQKQIQNDDRGKRAAKMYQFSATSTDHSELTITTTIRPSGLQILPSYLHNVGVTVCSVPQAGGGVPRAVASLIGMNKDKITRLVQENALPKFRSNIEKEAMEEGLERTQREAANRNSALAQYLIGNDRVLFRNLLIEHLTMRSRPQNALIGGKFEWLNGKEQVGAFAPQPSSLIRPDSGVSADVHLSSVLTNFSHGFIEKPVVQEVENLMIQTLDAPAGSPPGDGVKVTRNVDFPTFLRAVGTAQAANNPKVAALRVKRPTAPPNFGTDAQGNLVVMVKDFQIDLPAPPAMAKGGVAGPPARVLRIVSPQAEFSISFRVARNSDDEPLRVKARIESFDAGPRGRVFAINEDENQATPMNAFAGNFVLVGFRSKLQGQPIDIPLSNLPLRGFALRSVSPLDPSGWIRVTLVRTSDSPAAGVVPPPGAEPIKPPDAPVAGPTASTAASAP